MYPMQMTIFQESLSLFDIGLFVHSFSFTIVIGLLSLNRICDSMESNNTSCRFSWHHRCVAILSSEETPRSRRM